jgi:hypothetical protein
MHAAIVLLILILTYLGMAAGRIAWLRVDRTGIALLAVIALLASGEMTLDDFGAAMNLPTLALLFAMMIISAQFAESGFLDLCARTITGTRGGTAALLALTVAIGGAADHRLEPFAHLAGRLVRKGDREHLAGIGAAARQDVRKPSGQDARLAGAGAGQHEHGAVRRRDGLRLRLVERGEQHARFI